MADDLPGFGLVIGDVADGAAPGADAAVGGLDQPGAEQVGPGFQPVGAEAVAGRVAPSRRTAKLLIMGSLPGRRGREDVVRAGSWNPPVDQDERIAEILDALEMGGVAGDELQAVRQGDGGDHRVGQADGLADAFELASDAARQLGGGLVEGDDFFRGDSRQEVLQLPGRLLLLLAADHFHEGDGGDGIAGQTPGGKPWHGR